MTHISDDAIERARQTDLLSYLRYFEPDNLKQVSGDTYCTVEHDSLIISNGKWCWFSQGVGGRNAIDYLMKVRGMGFLDAVAKITGANLTSYSITHKTVPKKEFEMPELSETTVRAEAYLKSRGISPEIIRYCVEHGLIYETAKYHNVLFVGYDKEGKARYGALRSTYGAFKGDAKGSDKRFAFRIRGSDESRVVHVFESAPDLLSYATLMRRDGQDWTKSTFLSLAGVSDASQSVPRALEQFLKDYPSLNVIRLHLDNDEPGRKASAAIMNALKDKYQVLDEPPPKGKDYNDYLQMRKAIHKKPRTEVR